MSFFPAHNGFLSLGRLMQAGISGEPIPDPNRDLFLDHGWRVVGTGTLTDTTADGMHFVTGGSGASAQKKIDSIPGAVYTLTGTAFKVGTNTPLIRWGQTTALAANYGTSTVSNTTAQVKTFDSLTPSTLNSSYAGGGLGTSPTEIDLRSVSIRLKTPSVAVAGFGDSIGQGTYPLAPAKFTPSKLVPYSSLGGQTEVEIACRQGGLPLLITIPGNEIPASGSVSGVTLSTTVAQVSPVFSIFRNASVLSGTFTCKILGEECVLTADAAGAITLSRDEDGAAIPCPPGTRVYLDISLNARTLTQWFISGRNGIGIFSLAQSAAIDTAMTRWLTHGRYLFSCILPSTGDGDLTTAASIERVAKNNARAAKYGTKYVDFLPALQAAGDGSANDNSDIANGWVPRSLRVDSIHLTSTGYGICAGLMFDAHVANGYA